MTPLSQALNEANKEGWSTREIARRSEGRLSHAVVAKYLSGRTPANAAETILQAFADVFPSASIEDLREAAGRPRGEAKPYEPPTEANQLSERERRAVDELIRLLVSSGGAEIPDSNEGRSHLTAVAARKSDRPGGRQRIDDEH